MIEATIYVLIAALLLAAAVFGPRRIRRLKRRAARRQHEAGIIRLPIEEQSDPE